MMLFFRVCLFAVMLLAVYLAYGLFTERNDVTSLLQEQERSEQDEDDDDDDVPLRLEEYEGLQVIRLSREQQQQSGIAIKTLEFSSAQNEFKTYARVISIESLLEFKSNLNNIIAEKKLTQAELSNTEKKLARLKILHKEASNISNRQLQDAVSERNILRARLDAHNIKFRDLRLRSVQVWGESLTEMIMNDESEALQKLLRHDDVLLLLSLKSNQTLEEGLGYVFVSRDNNRLNARKAYIISNAPVIDSVMQGETYYLKTNGQNLRTGMRVVAWVQKDAGIKEGVFVPNEAVVYFAGKQWAFIQIDDELFVRKSIDNASYIGSGWLVSSNFSVGEKVIISGAQMLLSEELRASIPDEDDDP